MQALGPLGGLHRVAKNILPTHGPIKEHTEFAPAVDHRALASFETVEPLLNIAPRDAGNGAVEILRELAQTAAQFSDSFFLSALAPLLGNHFVNNLLHSLGWQGVALHVSPGSLFKLGTRAQDRDGFGV